MSLDDQLETVVSAALGRDVVVGGLERVTAGASREIWSFDAVSALDDRLGLILRRDPPGTEPRRITIEADAIAAAGRVGVPGPRIIAADDDPLALDAPYIVMDRIEGQTLPRAILRNPALATMRPSLAEQCGEALARIHSIPVAEVPGLATTDVLDELAADLAAFDEVSPALELGMRRLALDRPEPVDETVVHGDFRNGNLIVGDEGLLAVLDWELVHRGDPMQDLGYFCTRAWRFGGPAPAGGFGSYEELFAGYERVSGRDVDVDAVRWWELFGTVWWGVGCLRQARRHLSGAERSVELAAIGRRVVEQEYDTLVLLEGAGA